MYEPYLFVKCRSGEFEIAYCSQSSSQLLPAFNPFKAFPIWYQQVMSLMSNKPSLWMEKKSSSSVHGVGHGSHTHENAFVAARSRITSTDWIFFLPCWGCLPVLWCLLLSTYVLFDEIMQLFSLWKYTGLAFLWSALTCSSLVRATGEEDDGDADGDP